MIWKKRLTERQIAHITPFVIRPVIQRLINYGTIPEPYNRDFTVEWPDLSTDTQEEKYNVRTTQLEFLAKYRDAGLDEFFGKEDFMIKFLDMSEKEVKEILEKAEKQKRQDIDAEAAKIFEDTGKEESDFGYDLGLE